MRLVAVVALIVLLGAGCAPRAVRRGAATAGLPPTGTLDPLPATFTGAVRCADCPGVRWHLNVFRDGAFFLRTTRAGERGADDIGRWSVSADGGTLVLHGGRDAPVRLRIVDARSLRLLDAEGRPWTAGREHDLRRAEGLRPLEPRLALRGTYRAVAGRGRLTECLTGQRWRVAEEREHAALDAAYRKASRTPGADVLISLEGRVALRPEVGGTGLERALVVERLLGVWPGATCAAPLATAPLEGTYWKLTRLGERPVQVGAGEGEPHLVLHGELRRVSGSGGCNRLLGSYTRDGGRLRFGRIATTRRACPHGMAEEAAFTAALTRVRAWAILGEHLELTDAHGAPLARFEARALR